MNIDTVINSLEHAEDDNKRFALLLILSELIKSKKLDYLKLDQINTEAETKCKHLNKRLFNSIGAHFLARLIITKQQTENASPFLYKSLAMSILTQFLDYPSLVCDPVLLSKIDSISEIILIEPVDDISNRNLVLDTFKYLFTLSQFCPDYLCQNAGILETLMHKIILNQNYDKLNRQIEKFDDSANDDDLVTIACKLFQALCDDDKHKQFSSVKPTEVVQYLDIKNKKIAKCLQALLAATNLNQTEFKFCLLKYLNFFLTHTCTSKHLLDENNVEKTSDCLFSILNDLFKSKLTRAYKEVAFDLLNHFVQMFQFEYIYMKSRNFFYLIIHLLCIEIGFNLHDSVSSDAKNPIDRMSTLYSLMEQVIIILSTASPFETKDDDIDGAESDEDADNFEPELKKVIKVIVETLELIITFVRDTLADFKQLKANDLILLIASIRLLICWLAHESLLETELLELMPQLLEFAEYYQLSNKETEETVNVFEFLIPGLQRILIDQQEKLDNRLVKKKDLVRAEFLEAELGEKIDLIKAYLDKCYIYI